MQKKIDLFNNITCLLEVYESVNFDTFYYVTNNTPNDHMDIMNQIINLQIFNDPETLHFAPFSFKDDEEEVVLLWKRN